MAHMPSTAPLGGIRIEHFPPSSLKPDPNNARRHSQKQIVQLQATIREYGFTNPILVDEDLKVLAGHARLIAATNLKLKTVPCVQLHGLSNAQKVGLGISDNKTSDMSEFDPIALSQLLANLEAVDYNLQLTGFDTAEIDVLLEQPQISAADPADTIPEPQGQCVSRPGDLWELGPHQLLCGDALSRDSYELLLGRRRADLVFADNPYNLPIRKVSGLGRIRHPEFAMASGEMTPDEYTDFLTTTMRHLCEFSVSGSVHFHCIDWRHIGELHKAGSSVYADYLALCFWNKTNGGMGSLYRSKHELVFVYKNGTAPHTNNINLGRHGRHRTNVWDCSGGNAFHKGARRRTIPSSYRKARQPCRRCDPRLLGPRRLGVGSLFGFGHDDTCR